MSFERLLSDFEHKRWDSKPFDRLVAYATGNIGKLEQFASHALDHSAEGGAFFDLCLGHVSEPAFADLVERSVQKLRAGTGNQVVESVIAYASLQLPQLLHPHLDTLFRTRPNGSGYYENWPWRESGTSHREFLEAVLRSSTDDDEKWKAILCLLETRDADSIEVARSFAPHVQPARSFSTCLEQVGLTERGTRLFRPDALHLHFDDDYFEADRPIWMSRELHPTWRRPEGGQAVRFGGASAARCGLCSGALHHLVTLPSSLFDAEADGGELEISTCLACLGWEAGVLSYRHAADGTPTSLDQRAVEPRVPAGPLKSGVARVAPTPKRWRWQDWALANGRENLFRVFGHPSWIQSAEYPSCPSCSGKMEFVLQLDSELPTADGDGWLWGSGGMCYCFWCGPCRTTSLTWQCT